MILTESQRHALDTIIEMGSCFFSPQRALPQLKLRLFPLMAGPTGVGKSFLVQKAANTLGAHYLKVVRGDWMVVGGRGRPTTYNIIDTVITHQRVLLHIDELDKNNVVGSDWAAAIQTDLFGLIDGLHNIGAYLKETPFEGGAKPAEFEVRRCIRDNLFIVGSGTWQALHESTRPGSTVGFLARESARPIDVDALARAEAISPELLFRFNKDVLILTYPTLEETAHLLKSTGLVQLAREIGEEISPAQVDWNHGGMRVLEAMATRLVLAKSKANRVQKVPRQMLLPGDLSREFPHHG